MLRGGHLTWLGFLLFAGWTPHCVDDNKGESTGLGSLPPNTETIMLFRHFLFTAYRKVKYGNCTENVTLKLLKTQLKLWSARCLTRQLNFFHKTPSWFPHQRGSDKLTPLPEPLNLLKFAITVIFPTYCWFLSHWPSSCRTTQPW